MVLPKKRESMLLPILENLGRNTGVFFFTDVLYYRMIFTWIWGDSCSLFAHLSFPTSLRLKRSHLLPILANSIQSPNPLNEKKKAQEKFQEQTK